MIYQNILYYYVILYYILDYIISNTDNKLFLGPLVQQTCSMMLAKKWPHGGSLWRQLLRSLKDEAPSSNWLVV